MSKSFSTILKISAVAIALVAIVAAFVFTGDDQKPVNTKENTAKSQTKDTKKDDKKSETAKDDQQTVVAGSQANNAPVYVANPGSYVYSQPSTSSAMTVTATQPAAPAAGNNGGVQTPADNGNTDNGSTDNNGGNTGNGNNDGNTTNAAPTVSLAAPVANATVSGTVAVSATASDDKAVSNVQLKLDDNTVLATISAAPYSYSWNTTAVANGVHTLTAVATDAEGLTATASVTVTVNNVVATPGYNPQPQGTNFTGGRVSLTFDDGVSSIYQNALPLLHQYGFKSTQYLISATLTDNANYPGYFSADQAREFYSAATGVVGTELADHTMFHCSLVSSTTTDDPTNCKTGLDATQQAAQNQRELHDSKIALQGLFPDYNFNNIASPYGAYDEAAIQEMKDNGYYSHRSTDEGFNTYGTLDRYNILVQNVEKTTTVAQVKAWIDEAHANNTWLVLVYHDVAADGDTAGDYGVTKADLNEQLKYIQDTSVAGGTNAGLKVVTVAEALAENAQAGTN